MVSFPSCQSKVWVYRRGSQPRVHGYPSGSIGRPQRVHKLCETVSKISCAYTHIHCFFWEEEATAFIKFSETSVIQKMLRNLVYFLTYLGILFKV